MKHINASPKEVRKFGITFSVLAIGLAAFFFYKENLLWMVFLGGSLFFILTGMWSVSDPEADLRRMDDLRICFGMGEHKVDPWHRVLSDLHPSRTRYEATKQRPAGFAVRQAGDHVLGQTKTSRPKQEALRKFVLRSQ